MAFTRVDVAVRLVFRHSSTPMSTYNVEKERLQHIRNASGLLGLGRGKRPCALSTCRFIADSTRPMESTKAEAENIEPSAGKELLDKYWTGIKHEIDDINIVTTWRVSCALLTRLLFSSTGRVPHERLAARAHQEDHEVGRRCEDDQRGSAHSVRQGGGVVHPGVDHSLVAANRRESTTYAAGESARAPCGSSDDVSPSSAMTLPRRSPRTSCSISSSTSFRARKRRKRTRRRKPSAKCSTSSRCPHPADSATPFNCQVSLSIASLSISMNTTFVADGQIIQLPPNLASNIVTMTVSSPSRSADMTLVLPRHRKARSNNTRSVSEMD